MRPLGRTLMRYDRCPYLKKRGNLDTETRIEEKRCEEAEKIPSISQRIPEATRS